MENNKKKIVHTKYFEIPMTQALDWNWKDYILFLIETLYMTVFPFIGGMLLIRYQQLLWLGFLILPIYLRFKVQKSFRKEQKKRVYVK